MEATIIGMCHTLYEWYMARFMARNDKQKDWCCDEIGQCAHMY